MVDAGGDELLTPVEVAQVLKVHEATVRKWIREGRLVAVRTPGRAHRIRRIDLEPFTTPAPAEESA